MLTELIDEAKTLLAKIEDEAKQIEHAEPTQLRIAVSRLHLFREHLATCTPIVEQQAQEPKPKRKSTKPAQEPTETNEED